MRIVDVEMLDGAKVRVFGSERCFRHAPKRKVAKGEIAAAFSMGGVIPALARDLISEGIDPATVLHVCRAGVSVFAEDRDVRWWSGQTFPEGNQQSVQRRRYVPYERSQIAPSGVR